MSDVKESGTLFQSFSEAGIAAEHPSVHALPVLAAPATDEGFNTVRPHLSPIACWSIGDARFAFSSSFVLPDIAEDVQSLAALIRHIERKHGARPVATTFGHADPVGNDGFNKKLSGRRAAAVYALLTRRTDIWEDLYSQKGRFTSALSADAWGEPAVRTMLTDLGYVTSSHGGSDHTDAARAFQRDHGLEDDGVVGSGTRPELFRAYMQKHGRNRQGEPFELQATDFLGRGEDLAGKADYQGCSEFNPLLIFSKQEHNDFSKSGRKAERDAANAPNRRVLIYLFHPDVRIRSDAWPCPRAKEGTTGCRKRLWSDANERSRPGTEQRQFEQTGDTFACRFYDRLAHRSPCEEAVRAIVLRIRLFDPCNRVIERAPYRLTVHDQQFVGNAENDGFLQVEVVGKPRRCLVEWSGDEGENQEIEYRYQLELYLDYDQIGDPEEEAKRRLFNLGYAIDMAKDLSAQKVVIRQFQHDTRDRYKLKPNGEFTTATAKAIQDSHDRCEPVELDEHDQSEDGDEP